MGANPSLGKGASFPDVAVLLGVFALCFYGKQVASNIQAKRLELFAVTRTEAFRKQLTERLYEGGAAPNPKDGHRCSCNALP